MKKYIIETRQPEAGERYKELNAIKTAKVESQILDFEVDVILAEFETEDFSETERWFTDRMNTEFDEGIISTEQKREFQSAIQILKTLSTTK